MSKQSAVLAKVEELARRHGAGHLIEELRHEFSSLWSKAEEAPAAPATDTFNVTVGVEVLSSVRASQRDIEAAVAQALESAASGRDEVVSISVAGA